MNTPSHMNTTMTNKVPAEVSSPATPQLAEHEYSDAEIAELRADFYEFVKRRNLSPEVMAIVCPWLGAASSPTPALEQTIYKNPNCNIDHPDSSCNIACGE